ncbi:hypothetical protein LTR50_004083 [Elasticomyces elasticus]|nr:hypothetical protein LTR50_004083 [Elasticomyces elasticus]
MGIENTSGAPQTQKVTDVISTFRPSRLFKSPSTNTYITSLDFDDTGELALVARTDDTLQIYNIQSGKHAKEMKSQKYGAHLARFSHHAQSLIYASTKIDDNIRYLSTHDDSFLRYFRGHTDRVTSITLSPSDDTFLSSSLDNTVKLWNLNSASPQGELRLHAPYLTAYDPSATVIAIASPSTQSIVLYDLRNYDKPPFATFDMQEIEHRYAQMGLGQRIAEGWTKLEFSNNGQYILVATNGAGHYLLDAFEGHLRAFLQKPDGPTQRAAPGDAGSTQPPGQGDAAFSPDGQFVVGGSGTPGLLVWEARGSKSADKIAKPIYDLPGTRPGAVVGYNPRYNIVVAADKEVVLWLPDPDVA